MKISRLITITLLSLFITSFSSTFAANCTETKIITKDNLLNICKQIDSNTLDCTCVKSITSGAFYTIPFKNIRIRFSDIEKLPNDFFHLPTDIQGLTLEDGSINTIKPGFFKEYKKLKQLSLYKNDITHISKNMLNGLEELKDLDLAYNSIINIEDGAFSNLKNLKRLGLFGNNITQISKNTFDGLKQLEELEIALNPIINIEDGAFSNLENLKFLRISYAWNTGKNKHIFNGLDSLETLWIQDLDEKHISKDRTNTQKDFELRNFGDGIFQNLKNLKKLEIEGNYQSFDNTIKHLGSGDFSGLENLEVLYIDSSIPIEEIDEDTFDNLKNLKEISFLVTSKKGIHKNPFKKLKNLESTEVIISDISNFEASFLYDKLGILKKTTPSLISENYNIIKYGIIIGLSILIIVIIIIFFIKIKGNNRNANLEEDLQKLL